MASDNTQDLRKQMRVALVGIRPADQVTLKGYLRVLLRLDVELVWVSATDGNIHLFMVNAEFRSASSITRLLETNQGASILYVNRTEVGEGTIKQDLLTLPLKQINLLNDWLVDHVSILKGLPHGLNSGQTAPEVAEITPPAEVAQPKPVVQEQTVTLTSLVRLMQTLQERPQSLFELVDGQKTVALLDAKRQLVWVKDPAYKLTHALTMRLSYAPAPNAKESMDANQWLWQLAWQSPDILLPLIDNSSKHYLRFWVKPSQENRRDMLQVMTALENNALSVAEIASTAGVSVVLAKKMVAALLFSGNLSAESYQRLSARLSHLSGVSTSTPEPAVVATPAPTQSVPVQSTPSEPDNHAEHKTEKMGFLARLRRKLGL